MPADLSNMTEPVADPTAPVKKPKKTKTADPLGDLPRIEAEPEKAPKVSPRCLWDVTAVNGGTTYGPFIQEAVDESEAIQRVLDTQAPGLKALAVTTRFTATRRANAA